MGLQAVLNTQTDFTGEFPEEYAKDGLWRFNEAGPDGDAMLSDSSGKGGAARPHPSAPDSGGTISASTSQTPLRRKPI